MNHSMKRFVSLACIGFIFLHFLFVVMYSSPLNKHTTKLNFYSKAYSYPFFHQSWSLFAPTPTKKTALHVRFFSINTWSSWSNVLQNEINQHQKNVMKGNETTVLLFSNSLNYLVNSCKKKLYEKPPIDINYTILHHSVSNYLKNKLQLNSNTAFEILIISNAQKENKVIYFKNNIVP